jgi:hypothetical protein
LEPEVAAFLKRILTTIGIVLFWLGINSTVGIMFGYAFFEEGIKLSNVIFYIWLLISLPTVLLILKKMWSKKIEFDR